MAFKDVLKALRKDYDLTQEQLADRMGISKSAISMYENGNRKPDYEALEAFADIFNVDMNTLLGNVTKSTSPDSLSPLTTKAPESDDSDSEAMAERLYDFLISIGYLKPGQDLTDQQLEVLSGMVTILDAVFDEGKQ